MRLSVTRLPAILRFTPQAAPRELTAGAPERGAREFIKNCGGVGYDRKFTAPHPALGRQVPRADQSRIGQPRQISRDIPETLAHPTRFERVTFAFGGQGWGNNPRLPGIASNYQMRYIGTKSDRFGGYGRFPKFPRLSGSCLPGAYLRKNAQTHQKGRRRG
jgi:hypothetical protein